VKGTDERGHAPSDIAEQTTIAYNDMQSALAEFSANMSNIVDETYFVADVRETMEELQPSSVLTENPITCRFA
jgi:enamine deaminase RidA (YjgF/YER057c/UK114 family)